MNLVRFMSRITPLTQPYTAQHNNPTVTLTAQTSVNSLKGDAYVILSYKPDRAVVTASAFTDWLNKSAKQKWETWEEMATHLLDGFYDEALPLTVTLQLDIAENAGVTHNITLSQQQPAELRKSANG